VGFFVVDVIYDGDYGWMWCEVFVFFVFDVCFEVDVECVE